LIRPTPLLEFEFRSTIKEFRSNGETEIETLFDYSNHNFQLYIYKTQLMEAGKELPEGYVSFSTFWLINDQKHIIGFSNIRHYLTSALCIEGGHIGYSIRPCERGKGYGKQQLALILVKCLNLGIKEILITCDFDNAASAKIIEANGGIRIGETISTRTGKVVFQYRISI